MITVDARCSCKACTDRTTSMYRMVGTCSNCGTQDILMLFRSGDRASARDCPVCGVYNSVRPHRLATSDEVPAS